MNDVDFDCACTRLFCDEHRRIFYETKNSSCEQSLKLDVMTDISCYIYDLYGF